MDVPLKNQTRECLIALVESMDKQAKDDEKRRAALEKENKIYREVLNKISREYDGCVYEHPKDAKRAFEMVQELDALTPTQEKTKK